MALCVQAVAKKKAQDEAGQRDVEKANAAMAMAAWSTNSVRHPASIPNGQRLHAQLWKPNENAVSRAVHQRCAALMLNPA